MKAFEIYVNGRHLATAGTGHILSTVVTWSAVSPPAKAGGEFSFHLGGVDGQIGELVDWPVPEVGVGDEITIKIVEADRVSPGEIRSPSNPPLPGETWEDYERRLQAEVQGDEPHEPE